MEAKNHSMTTAIRLKLVAVAESRVTITTDATCYERGQAEKRTQMELDF